MKNLITTIVILVILFLCYILYILTWMMSDTELCTVNNPVGCQSLIDYNKSRRDTLEIEQNKLNQKNSIYRAIGKITTWDVVFQ